jgi:hypothetical protein
MSKLYRRNYFIKSLYICNKCKYESSYIEMIQHIKEAHPDKCVACFRCNKLYVCQLILMNHIKKRHCENNK